MAPKKALENIFWDTKSGGPISKLAPFVKMGGLAFPRAPPPPVHITRLILSCLTSSHTFRLNWACCNWSRPRQSRSLHSARLSSPWLRPITAHSVQMRWGQMRWNEMNDMNAPWDWSGAAGLWSSENGTCEREFCICWGADISPGTESVAYCRIVRSELKPEVVLATIIDPERCN